MSKEVQKVKKIPLKRGHSRRFTVWFNDGTNVIMFGKYPSDILDTLHPAIAVKVRNVEAA